MKLLQIDSVEKWFNVCKVPYTKMNMRWLQFTHRPTQKELSSGCDLLEYEMRYDWYKIGQQNPRKSAVLSSPTYYFIYDKSRKCYGLIKLFEWTFN